MQHLQDNYSSVRFGTLLVAALVFAAIPATADGPNPDPMLHAQSDQACGAAYVAGVDADGDAVIPADMAAAKPPVPPQVVVPLANHRRGQDGGYVMLDGQQIKPLIDPKPCR
jgi:hypothetical protein